MMAHNVWIKKYDKIIITDAEEIRGYFCDMNIDDESDLDNNEFDAYIQRVWNRWEKIKNGMVGIVLDVKLKRWDEEGTSDLGVGIYELQVKFGNDMVFDRIFIHVNESPIRQHPFEITSVPINYIREYSKDLFEATQDD